MKKSTKIAIYALAAVAAGSAYAYSHSSHQHKNASQQMARPSKVAAMATAQTVAGPIAPIEVLGDSQVFVSSSCNGCQMLVTKGSSPTAPSVPLIEKDQQYYWRVNILSGASSTGGGTYRFSSNARECVATYSYKVSADGSVAVSLTEAEPAGCATLTNNTLSINNMS